MVRRRAAGRRPDFTIQRQSTRRRATGQVASTQYRVLNAEAELAFGRLCTAVDFISIPVIFWKTPVGATECHISISFGN